MTRIETPHAAPRKEKREKKEKKKKREKKEKREKKHKKEKRSSAGQPDNVTTPSGNFTPQQSVRNMARFIFTADVTDVRARVFTQLLCQRQLRAASFSSQSEHVTFKQRESVRSTHPHASQFLEELGGASQDGFSMIDMTAPRSPQINPEVKNQSCVRNR